MHKIQHLGLHSCLLPVLTPNPLKTNTDCPTVFVLTYCYTFVLRVNNVGPIILFILLFILNTNQGSNAILV